jgi:hypothetical protein
MIAIDSKLTFSDLHFPQLSEDGKNIRRVKPIPGTYDPIPTSIYAVWPFTLLLNMWIQRDEIAKCNKLGPVQIVYINDVHGFCCGAVVPPDLTKAAFLLLDELRWG